MILFTSCAAAALLPLRISLISEIVSCSSDTFERSASNSVSRAATLAGSDLTAARFSAIAWSMMPRFLSMVADVLGIERLLVRFRDLLEFRDRLLELLLRGVDVVLNGFDRLGRRRRCRARDAVVRRRRRATTRVHAASPRSATARTTAAAAASQIADDRARGARRRRVSRDPSFLAQPSGDLQPRAIGRLERRQRRGGVVDPLQVVEQRAARGARVEMQLELGAADRSDRAVDGLVDRVQILLARHNVRRSQSQFVVGRFA